MFKTYMFLIFKMHIKMKIKYINYHTYINFSNIYQYLLTITKLYLG